MSSKRLSGSSPKVEIKNLTAGNQTRAARVEGGDTADYTKAADSLSLLILFSIVMNGFTRLYCSELLCNIQFIISSNSIVNIFFNWESNPNKFYTCAYECERSNSL